MDNDLVISEDKENEGSNKEKSDTGTSIAKSSKDGENVIQCYDLKKFYADLQSNEEDVRVFNNSALISELKNFCIRYNFMSKPVAKNLYAYKAKGHDAAKLLRMLYGDTLRYSEKYDGFYKWDGKQYVKFKDVKSLTWAISESLTIVEHSAFQWIMTDVKGTLLQMRGSDNYKARGEVEKSALAVLKKAEDFTSNNLAEDIQVQYMGMWGKDDFKGYQENPYLNFQNGVLDLETMELHPHSTKYKQDKIMGCDYDPEADCPEFRAMIERMLPEDSATQKELQKALGLCLAKENLPARKVFNCLIGVKDSGKTTLMNAVLRTLGEYGTSVDSSLLMITNKDKTRGPEMAQFMETLLVNASESNESDKLDTSLLKKLTGNDALSFRYNNSNIMIRFMPICVLFLDSNYRPYIPPREAATWDRFRYFGFDYPIKEKRAAFDKVLDKEKSGIFNYLLQGLRMVEKEGEISETPSMLKCKEQFRKDVDTIGQFISECLEKSEDEGSRIATSQVFSAYQAWAKDNGYMEIVKTKFHESMREHFPKKKSGVEVYTNINYSDLGFLYSRRNELTLAEFAKEKRKLQEKKMAVVPYQTLRASYFKKSWGWFIKNVKPKNAGYGDNMSTMYENYASFCGENGWVCLTLPDFKAKVLKLWTLTYQDGDIPKLILDANAFEYVKDCWS